MQIRAVTVAAVFVAIMFAGCIGDENSSTDSGPGVISADQPGSRAGVLSPGKLATFSANLDDPLQVLWRIDGAFDNNTTAQHTFGRTGLFRVILEVIEGDEENQTRWRRDSIAAVGNQSSAGLSFETTPVALGERFTADGVGNNAAEYAWDFGDGTIGFGQSPTHAYAVDKKYTVKAYALVDDTIYRATKTITPSTLAPTWQISDVGFRGPEPSIGITSSGCMFFAAMEKVMRSCDAGLTWEDTKDVFSQQGTSDPWLWVDPVTDRIFNVQMLSLVCTWIAWSDDDGESWLGNPADCGPIPVNDHIKLSTGAWTELGLGTIGNVNPVYETAVYFCYNKVAGAWCFTSMDGGATFPIGGFVTTADQVSQPVAEGVTVEAGGLHGAVTAAPDGTVYLPVRTHTPKVAVSQTNGVAWDVVLLGQDVGTADQIKNPEVAADTDNNAYMTWVGPNQNLYLSRSLDSGATWDDFSLRLTPEGFGSVVFPALAAGAPGVVAAAYYGTEDHNVGAWEAPEDTRWYLYVTYTTNALDDEPDWVTVKVWDDPLQVGHLCVQGCLTDPGFSTTNRNHLDFIDLTLDLEGRMYIAFADGCTNKAFNDQNPCIEDLASLARGSRDSQGIAAWLDTGISLYGEQLQPKA